MLVVLVRVTDWSHFTDGLQWNYCAAKNSDPKSASFLGLYSVQVSGDLWRTSLSRMQCHEISATVEWLPCSGPVKRLSQLLACMLIRCVADCTYWCDDWQPQLRHEAYISLLLIRI